MRIYKAKGKQNYDEVKKHIILVRLPDDGNSSIRWDVAYHTSTILSTQVTSVLLKFSRLISRRLPWGFTYHIVSFSQAHVLGSHAVRLRDSLKTLLVLSPFWIQYEKRRHFQSV